MTSADAVSELYNSVSLDLTSKSKIVQHYEDLIANVLFRRAHDDLSELSKVNISRIATMIASSPALNALGTSNVGQSFGNIYQSILSRSAGITINGTTHYGHSLGAMTAAGAMASYLGDITHGSGARAIGGNLNTNTALVQEYIARNGLGANAFTTFSRDTADPNQSTLGRLFASLDTPEGRRNLGIGTVSRDAIKTTELKREFFNFLSQHEGFKGLDAKGAVKAFNETDAATKNEILEQFRAQAMQGMEKSGHFHAVNNDLEKSIYATLVDKKLTAADAEDYTAQRGKPTVYTGLSESMDKEIRTMLKHSQAAITDLGELVGTDDINQLKALAQQFGIQTMTAENDIKNIKHLISTARSRAIVLGKSLPEVITEMQGIAAIGAQAVGGQNVSVAYTARAATHINALEDTRAAGGITKEEQAAAIAASEQNRVNHLATAAALLDNKTLKNDTSPEMTALRESMARIQAGNGTEQDFETVRVLGESIAMQHYGRNYNKEELVRRGTQSATYNAVAEGADKSVLQWHAADLAGQFMETAGVQAISDPAQRAIVSQGANAAFTLFGGKKTARKAHMEAVKNALASANPEEAFAAYRAEELKKYREAGATEEQIQGLAALLDTNKILLSSSDASTNMAAEALVDFSDNSQVMRGMSGSDEDIKINMAAAASLKDRASKSGARLRHDAVLSSLGGTHKRWALSASQGTQVTTEDVLLKGLSSRMGLSKQSKVSADGTFNAAGFDASKAYTDAARTAEDKEKFSFNYLLAEGKLGLIQADGEGNLDANKFREQYGNLKRQLDATTDPTIRKAIEGQMKLMRLAAGGKNMSEEDFEKSLSNLTHTTLAASIVKAEEQGDIATTVDAAGNIAIADAAAIEEEKKRVNNEILPTARAMQVGFLRKHAADQIHDIQYGSAGERKSALKDLKAGQQFVDKVYNTLGISKVDTKVNEKGEIEKTMWTDSDGTVYDTDDFSDIVTQAIKKDPSVLAQLRKAAASGDEVAQSMYVDIESKAMGSTTGSFADKAMDKAREAYIEQQGGKSARDAYIEHRNASREALHKWRRATTAEGKKKALADYRKSQKAMMQVKGVADMFDASVDTHGVQGDNANYMSWLKAQGDPDKAGKLEGVIFSDSKGQKVNAADILYNEGQQRGMVATDSKDQLIVSQNINENVQNLAQAIIPAKDVDTPSSDQSVRTLLTIIAKRVQAWYKSDD